VKVLYNPNNENKNNKIENNEEKNNKNAPKSFKIFGSKRSLI
jgi:hypothetical protein